MHSQTRVEAVAGPLARPVGQAGFSLVEMMAAVTITLFVMAGVFGLMVQNQQTYETQTQLADVQQAARVAIDLMTREIRMAGADPSGRAFSPDATCSVPTPPPTGTPEPQQMAPITVATATKIRIKMDRPTYALGPEPSTTPTPAPGSPYLNDCSADGDYNEDDEDGRGDGFLNDDSEDVEYEYVAADSRLYRREYRTDPDSACRCSGAGASPGTATVPIAENVVGFRLKYYSGDAPEDSCPAGSYATEADYEAARDACDTPLADTPPDQSLIRRVRMRLVIETEKADPLKKAAVGGTGKRRLSLTSQAVVRNREL